MKNLLSKLLILIGCVTLYALPQPYEFYESVSNIRLPNETIIEDFYKERIPEEYCDAFLFYTEDMPEIRMNFYCIMVIESSNFRYFVGKNKNGTTDLGPSQLNSSNINNERFVKAFTPEDKSHITTEYCRYMVLSIGYYKDLYKRFGDAYAFYAYNGGDKAAKQMKKGETHNGSLIKNVTAYDTKVRKVIDEKSKELETYIVERRAKHVDEVMEELGEILIIEPDDIRRGDFNYSFDKTINNLGPYIFKRQELLKFESEEFIIIINSLIYGFCYEFINRLAC